MATPPLAMTGAPTARDDRRELVERGPREHAVARDVGDDQRADARVVELLREADEVEAGGVGPAVDRDVAAAGVEPDRDLPGMQSRSARRRPPGVRPPRCR